VHLISGSYKCKNEDHSIPGKTADNRNTFKQSAMLGVIRSLAALAEPQGGVTAVAKRFVVMGDFNMLEDNVMNLSEKASLEFDQPIQLQAICCNDKDEAKRRDWILANGEVIFVASTVRAKDGAHLAVVGRTVLGSAPAASIAAPTRDTAVEEVTPQDIRDAKAALSQTREADRVREMEREDRVRQEEMSGAGGVLGDIDETIGPEASEGAFPDASPSAVAFNLTSAEARVQEAIKQLDVVDSGGNEQAATTPAANTADDEQAVAKKTRRGQYGQVPAWDQWGEVGQIDPASPPPPTDAVRPAPLLASPQGQSTASAASASASAAQALPVSRASAETATVAVSIDDDMVLLDADIADPAAAEADANLRAAAALEKELQEDAKAAAAERADRVPAVGSFRYESRDGSGGFVRLVTSARDQELALAAVLAIRRRTMVEFGEGVAGVARWSTQKNITKRVVEQWWQGKPPEEREEVKNRVGGARQAQERTKRAYFRAAAKAHFGDIQWYYFTVAVGEVAGPEFITLQTQSLRPASSRDTAEQSGGGSGSQARGPKTGIRHTVSDAKAAREKTKLAMKHSERMVRKGAGKADARWKDPEVWEKLEEVEDSSWHSTWGPRCRGADVNPCPPAVRAALARMPPHCHARPHPRAIPAQQVFDSPRRGGASRASLVVVGSDRVGAHSELQLRSAVSQLAHRRPGKPEACRQVRGGPRPLLLGTFGYPLERRGLSGRIRAFFLAREFFAGARATKHAQSKANSHSRQSFFETCLDALSPRTPSCARTGPLASTAGPGRS